MRRTWGIIGFCLGMCLSLKAQESPEVGDLLESLDILPSEEEYDAMVSTLTELKNAPLSLNTVDFDSLKLLFLLSDSQIDQILTFREKHGNFLHLNELLLVPGIGYQDFRNVRAFVTTGDFSVRERSRLVLSSSRQEWIARVRTTLPKQEGYKKKALEDFEKVRQYEKHVENRFKGPPLGSLIKYKGVFRQLLQVGVVLENDPGEAYFTRNQKAGFDFWSAHLCVTGDRLIRRLIVGDFRVQWGQGLVAWGGFSSGKSATALGNEKAGGGLAPSTSTDENRFFRGIALTVRPLPNITAEVFFSAKKTDGNLLQGDTLEQEDVLMASVYQSGYHRSLSECRKKHQLNETATGLSGHWNTRFFKIGINSLYYDFSPALQKGNAIYQQYNDDGRKRWLVSVDYKSGYKNWSVFGETARSDTKGIATLNGIRVSSPKVSACAIYRYYAKQYVCHYASGFGEYSNTSNEEGVYIGLNICPGKNLKLNFYYDWFRFFSPRYRAFVPGTGTEFLGELSYTHAGFGHTFYFKREIKPENRTARSSVSRGKNNFRYQLRYVGNKCWEFRSRVTATQYKKDERQEWGYMLHQDVLYTSVNTNFKMQFRLGYFHTDSYDTRVYAYENNVLYGYSFPMFMNEGWRTYVNMSWKINRTVTCYLKSGFTVYPGKEVMSSGVSQVKGNKLYDLAFQLRFRI